MTLYTIDIATLAITFDVSSRGELPATANPSDRFMHHARSACGTRNIWIGSGLHLMVHPRTSGWPWLAVGRIG